jgi:uncharacterized membrane protein YphA (DoxX/SURF4 family)
VIRISFVRLGDGALAASTRQFGTFALVALVVLRVGIGFHFFTEGAGKLNNPKPFSANFFTTAKGPFSSGFQNLVWDADGVARLDLEQTREMWDHFRERVARNYNFSEQQAEQAGQAFKRRLSQFETHLAANRRDIDEYKLGLARRDDYRGQKDRVQVASLRGQIEKIEGELRAKRSELLGPIDLMWSGYEAELNGLAAAEQRPWGPVELGKPDRRVLDSEGTDAAIPWFDLAIGVLLMLGLFTRTAAIVGALFLCSVMVSQWPGTEGAIPVWSQFIEASALVVVAATATGRIAGVDYFLGLLRGWCCPPKQGTQS